jgi:hypothetical protein
MPSKRRLVFKRMCESIQPILPYIQHVVVIDKQCTGLKNAGHLVFKNRDKVKGYYVLMVDDDDELTCCNLPFILERARNVADPDIIIVRTYLENYGIFPSKEKWQEKNIMNFPECSLSTSNYIFKNSIWNRHLHILTEYEELNDWHFFNNVTQSVNEFKYSHLFLDVMVIRQQYESMRSPERQFDEITRKIIFNEVNES